MPYLEIWGWGIIPAMLLLLFYDARWGKPPHGWYTVAAVAVVGCCWPMLLVVCPCFGVYNVGRWFRSRGGGPMTLTRDYVHGLHTKIDELEQQLERGEQCRDCEDRITTQR